MGRREITNPLVFAALLTLGPSGHVSAQSQRRFVVISPEAARERVEEVVRSGSIPNPSPQPFSSWLLPKGADASGVKINDNDYVLFASAQPKGLKFLHVGDLTKLLPSLQSATSLQQDASTKGQSFQCWLNGIFYTSADLQLIETASFGEIEKWASGKWVPKDVISRGGYSWWLCEMGVLLTPSSDMGTFLAFKGGLPDFHTDTTRPGLLAPARFSITALRPDVVVKVADKEFRFK